SSRLAYAYGIAVTGTMVMTTCIGFYYYYRIAKWPLIPVAAFALLLLTVDLRFLVSNLTKVLEGGWLPIAVGISIVIVMETWRRGRKLLAEQFLDGAVPLDTLLRQASEQKIQRVKGAAVFLTANLDVVQTALLHNLKHNQVLHKRVALLRVSTEDTPRVPLAEQLKVET